MRRTSRLVILALAVTVAVAASACDVLTRVEEPTLTDIRAERDGYRLELRAPGWTFGGTTHTFLCPTHPGEATESNLQETGCIDLGASDESSGYAMSINLESLSSTQFLMFDGSPEWFVVLMAGSPGGVVETTAIRPIPGGPIE